MGYLLEEKLKAKDVSNYKVCYDRKRIINIEQDDASKFSDALRVVSILSSLEIKYIMTDNYDFNILH